jgi:hypothetical protein
MNSKNLSGLTLFIAGIYILALPISELIWLLFGIASLATGTFMIFNAARERKIKQARTQGGNKRERASDGDAAGGARSDADGDPDSGSSEGGHGDGGGGGD